MTATDMERRRDLFAARVAAFDDRLPGYRFVWEHWRAQLLAIAGVEVVPSLEPDADLDLLLTMSSVRDGAGALAAPGRPSSCHENAAELLAAGSTDCGVAVASGWTGYALSDDGLWRSHSWAISTTGRIIETTTPRTHYVGYELT